MTIWAIPFRAIDRQTTGPGADSGFESFEALVQVMGKPTYKYKRKYIYGKGADRVLFTDIPAFHVDPPDITR